MTDFLFFSYLAVSAASLVLWYDAAKRTEYGKRPAVFLVSIIMLAFSGLVLLVFTILLGENQRTFYKPLASLLSLFSFGTLFVLEYSVHVQRIRKSFLFDDFKTRLRPLYIFLAISGALFIVMTVLFPLMTGVGLAQLFASAPAIDSEAMRPYQGVANWLYLLFTASLFVCANYTNRLFKFHEGIIRQRKYPFTLFNIFIALMLIPGIFSLNFLTTSPFFPFIIPTIVFAVSAFHEYFLYRMFHLNDLHAKLAQAEKSRTEIINRVIASNAEEDYRMIKETLSTFLEAAQRSLAVTTMRFNAVMAYRKKGDILQVDSPEMILNYCVPLIKLDAVKRISQREINALIMQQVYRLPDIQGAARESITDMGELAVKDMLQSKDRVIIPIPPQFKGVFRLIAAYPVFNHEELTGFVVLFKTEFDQILPQEDTTIRNLTGNLSIIFAIMSGKQTQQEKNRLSGEMDIARGIQTSIVPRSLSLPGYEASCAMTTASEVGGDLYDFFPMEFGNYIDIGDVAGHGLPAGMMALIHMSALHGVLFTSQVLKRELAISDVYDIINKVLCSINKKRIGSDKFMTCSVLVERNGTFTHAGTHLIALLYRKAPDAVVELRDMIDKTAFLGLTEYVSSKQSEGSFSMEKGDVLLLYTDGAIEAKNQRDEQYGLENLKLVFRQNIGQDPDSIITAIMDSVAAFAESGDMKKFGGKLADDVSLVVLRRT